MLGFAVTILDNYWAIVWTPRLAITYQWILVVSLLALRGNAFPRLLAYLGIAAAIAYFLVVISMVFPDVRGMILVVAGIGGVVLGPIWYIWMGVILHRTRSQ
jgi:hypothetical protein